MIQSLVGGAGLCAIPVFLYDTDPRMLGLQGGPGATMSRRRSRQHTLLTKALKSTDKF